MRLKSLATVAVLLLGLPGLSGCYLGHAAVGQLALLRARRPIADVVADPATPPDVRAQLQAVGEVLVYARELGLATGERYTSYVDWPGDRLVTSVVATRPGEIEPAPFWFPIVGQVPYKGFFTLDRAEAEASRLQAEGLDTCLLPVPAYSTLGWFSDPVTAPMLRRGEGALLETVLHELVHATVFAPSAADFNEGLATFIGRHALLAYYGERAADDAVARERSRLAREDRVVAALLRHRERVAAHYDATDVAGDAAASFDREALETETRHALEAALAETGGDPADAARYRLNDACLALTGTYRADLPRYAARFEALGGDLAALLAAAAAAAESDDPRASLLGP